VHRRGFNPRAGSANLGSIAARDAAANRRTSSMNTLSTLLSAAAFLAGALAPAAAGEPSADKLLAAFLGYFASGNIEAMVDAHAPDATFATAQGVLKGRDQVRGMIGGVVAEFAKPGASFAIIRRAADGPLATLVRKGETADHVYEIAAETYLFADGKIAQHTFAAKVSPK
jgi:limonene-1,2-epoxide hydrolase